MMGKTKVKKQEMEGKVQKISYGKKDRKMENMRETSGSNEEGSQRDPCDYQMPRVWCLGMLQEQTQAKRKK
jgi:hypothetical protein